MDGETDEVVIGTTGAGGFCKVGPACSADKAHCITRGPKTRAGGAELLLLPGCQRVVIIEWFPVVLSAATSEWYSA